MMRHYFCILILFLAAQSASAESPSEASWIFQPSAYSHDAQGQRVAQYATPPSAYRPDDSQYRQWSYRHRDTHIRVGGSCDYWHTFETWRIP